MERRRRSSINAEAMLAPEHIQPSIVPRFRAKSRPTTKNFRLAYVSVPLLPEGRAQHGEFPPSRWGQRKSSFSARIALGTEAEVTILER